jgi:hypothetical protein
LPDGIDQLGDKAFIIERFDRREDGTSVHIEDFVRISEEPDSVFAKSRTAVSVTPGQSGPVDRCTAVIHPG